MPPKTKPARMQPGRSAKSTRKARATKKVTDPKSGECTICFENYNNDYGELKCSHVYCFQCISNWSAKENTCPLCKGRFSFIMRIQKDTTTNEYSQKRVTVKKKNQTPAASVTIAPFHLFVQQILSNMQNPLYNDDDDDDYHEGDEDDEDDFFPVYHHHPHHHHNVHFVNDDYDDGEDDDDRYYYPHPRYISQQNRGSLDNPINLLDTDEDSFHTSTGTVNSSSNAGANTSSSSQPVIIDLTDDQIQSDIRDISVEEASLESVHEEESDSRATNNRKRRRQFHASDELEAEFASQRSRNGGHRSSAVLLDEEDFEL